jgi:outer membrane scaffolding protein for murein synthesis (MipA/OmpV family)
MKAVFLAGAAVALAVAAPAVAQDAAPPQAEPDLGVFAGDYLSLGIGPAYGPTYDGSDDYRVFPLPLIQARWHGIQVSPRAGGVALDFLPGTLNLGIAGRVRFNRTGKTRDPVVDRLGKLDAAIEVGPTAGVSLAKVLDPYDSLSFSVDALWDVAGAHGGMVVDPSIDYFTPVSRGIAASFSLNAEYGDEKFQDYYYRITPAQSIASGLPVYDPGSGFTKVGANLLVGFDLDGNLADGGFAIALVGSYARMVGDVARSPIVAIRGSRDQWIGGLLLGYTF